MNASESDLKPKKKRKVADMNIYIFLKSNFIKTDISKIRLVTLFMIKEFFVGEESGNDLGAWADAGSLWLLPNNRSWLCNSSPGLKWVEGWLHVPLLRVMGGH